MLHRKAQIRVGYEFLADCFKDAPQRHLVKGLPDDAKLVNMYFDPFGCETVFLIFESSEFQEIQEGQQYPLIHLQHQDCETYEMEMQLQAHQQMYGHEDKQIEEHSEMQTILFADHADDCDDSTCKGCNDIPF